MDDKREFIAHENQTLKSHLEGVAEICRKNADKIGCGDYGELLGLLHDYGKYSSSFQDYIKSAVGLLDPDADEGFVDAKELKGKIDHSTAGAQFLWERLSKGSPSKMILAQILALCLVSHHSGIIDCLTTDSQGTNDTFTKRIKKSDEKTHFKESCAKAEVIDRLENLIALPNSTKPLEMLFASIFATAPEKNKQSTVFQFQLGLLVRFFFSCLIDADRQDTADSEKPKAARLRNNGEYPTWLLLIKRLQRKLDEFGTPKTLVDKIRTDISKHCLEAAHRNRGVFTLSVPTGGGKTIASLRFALHHADKYNLDRIIFVIPFTSIIDQNAEVVRKILEPEDIPQDKGRIVLEHHSNVGAEKQSWKEKLLTENWDAPIVYTTMVQLLETLFGSGTRGARRMHQLAKSVIIFDEIQTLPIKCVHIFCNAINFLVNQCGSSVVLCTATQPLLGEVDIMKGALQLTPANEIMPKVQKLYTDLRRVEVFDSRKSSGWKNEEIAELAIEEINKSGSCLVVVNMKKPARVLFQILEKKTDLQCYHLSTGMCPAHRKTVLKEIRQRLEVKLPTICVSTQLIEAGVDVDFGSVIRFMAGLDSIAQAAGRCNRNGIRDTGNVHIVNPAEENLDCLKDIAVGKEKTARVLNDFKDAPEKYLNDRIGPLLLKWYYQNYFYDRKAEMEYPVSEKNVGRNDTLLNLLSTNSLAAGEYKRVNNKWPEIFLRQSFMTAAETFKSIDAPTQSVIVRFGEEGKDIVNQLCSAFDVEKQFKLLRKAQQFSVNLFPHEFKKLADEKVLYPVQEDTEIFWLDDKYYSKKFGLSLEPVTTEEVLYV